MKKCSLLLFLIWLTFGTVSVSGAQASEELNEDSLQSVEQSLKDETSISYTKIVKKLMKGNIKSAVNDLTESLSGKLKHNFLIQKNVLKQMIAAALIAAVFKNLSDSFFQGSTGNTAFYVTYIILIGLMTNSFFYLNTTVQNLVNLMLDYMKGMISAYSIAVVSTSGISTSTAVYEFYLLIIYAMSAAANMVLLPMIKILFVLKSINHISEEEHFSRLCKTLEFAAGIFMKGILSVILGIQLIQSMILPAVDSLKNTALQKGMSAIPGIGGGLSSVMTTILGSAVVIKNSIGAAGILILIVLVVPPFLEISCVVVSYMGAGILLQPVSDKRVTGAMDAVIQSGKLMLQMILTMTMLFILSIAMIAFSTNVNYYTG